MKKQNLMMSDTNEEKYLAIELENKIERQNTFIVAKSESITSSPYLYVGGDGYLSSHFEDFYNSMNRYTKNVD